MSKHKKDATPSVRISSDVVRQIRQHARSNSKTEVCGVLIGSDANEATCIAACIAGVNAAQGGAHVTFTQDTWEHIYKVKDRDYPEERILGWYHSHPGFGVFLSDHDAFIHKNFFSAPHQVAWVFDPHSDEEGCFGWHGQRLERLAHVSVVDQRGGEEAGETGKSEPSSASRGGAPVDEFDDFEEEPGAGAGSGESDLAKLARTVSTVFSYIAIFILGAVASWYLLPHLIPVGVGVDRVTGKQYMIDLKTGKPIAEMPSDASDPNVFTVPSLPASDSKSAAPPASNTERTQPAAHSDTTQPASQTGANPAQKKRDDVH
jgi:proteasome lid subunit RPN8/RPN11